MGSRKKWLKPMKDFGIKHERELKTASFILLTILFFSLNVILTYDSSHYMGYVSILESNIPFSSWDIVRGPSFPLVLFLDVWMFGKTNVGILIGLYLVFLVFFYYTYKVTNLVCEKFKHKKLITWLVTIITAFNPIIFGYFHVLLTEYLAITLFIVTIYVSIKWLSMEHASAYYRWLYIVFFALDTCFCYFLKQPFLFAATIPLIIAVILSVVSNHEVKNVLYRTGTLMATIIFLAISIVTWNGIMRAGNVNFDTGRGSGDMATSQLLSVYEVEVPEDSNQSISLIEAFGLAAKTTITNPMKIGKIYFKNYCAIISLCKIKTNDAVVYYATTELDFVHLFENDIIAYRPFRQAEENTLSVPDKFRGNVETIIVPVEENITTIVFQKAMRLTSLFYKIVMILLGPLFFAVIVVAIVKKKVIDRKYFFNTIIILGSAFLFLAISAGEGLIIDRYGVESFVPGIVGLVASFAFIKTSCTKKRIEAKK